MIDITSRDEIAAAILRTLTACKPSDIVFVCIGTDRSTGDSLGPQVGTLLVATGYPNVYGTLDEPVHAMNLAETIERLPAGKTVIAVDAALGSVDIIGRVTVRKGPVKPGAGVQKELPAVGDYAITGCVNVGGFMEYFVLQNTRLAFVTRMAAEIVAGILAALPVKRTRKRRSSRKKPEAIPV
jgi:putative sporulation protein YyaC